MTAKTGAERQRDSNARRRAAGLVKCEVWAQAEHHAAIKALADRLKKRGAQSAKRREPA